MQLEFHQLDLKYEHLRLRSIEGEAHLIASLSRFGQRESIWVRKENERYVVMDGYQRVFALRKLGKDTVEATILEMGEVEALLWSFDLGRKQRSVLEEAWALNELVEHHHLSAKQIGDRLNRCVSWVSRRLSLAKDLLPGLEEAIRKEEVCVHAAMKYMIPLARANRGQCEILLKSLRGQKLSERQLQKIYTMWREGKHAQRESIVQNPILYLRMEEAITDEREPIPGESSDAQLAKDFHGIACLCRRAQRTLRKSYQGTTQLLPSVVRMSFQEVQHSYSLLQAAMIEEEKDAKAGHT